MQLRTSFIFLGASLLTVMPASADGFYADLGYSRMVVDDLDSLDIDPDLDAVGAHFGFDVSEYFAIEGELITGLSDLTTAGSYTTPFGEIDAPQFSVTDYEAEFSLSAMVGAYARANFPVTPKLKVFGRAGFAAAEVDSRSILVTSVPGSDEVPIQSLYEDSESESGLAFGAGATYDLSDKIYVRGDFTRYDFDVGELDNFMIGAGLRF